MTARLTVALAALLLAASLALTACDSSESGSRTPPAGGKPIVVFLDVQPEAKVGETIPLKLIVRNVSDRRVELALGGQESDGFAASKDFVAVSLADQKEVWRWSHGKGVDGILGSKTLEPGEELALQGEWDQRDNQGRAVAPGSYLVRGAFREGDPGVRTLETEPVTLSISR